MATLIDYNLQQLIEEIQLCSKNKQYFAALSAALILPDICSKIESEKGNTKKNGERYIAWCNKWLKNIPSVHFHSQTYGSWGRIIYKLRCGVLHSGELDVCEKEYIAFNLRNFNFFINDDPSRNACALQICNKQENREYRDGETIEVKINIEIRYLINAIINGTKAFINSYELNENNNQLFSIHQYPIKR